MTKIAKEYVAPLLPKQAEFMFGVPEENFHLVDKETGFPIIYRDVACYQGGVGSGKTYSGSYKGIYLALKYPGIRGLVGAATQDLIDNTTKAQYIEHLTNMGFEEGTHYFWTDRKTLLHLFNGSLIYFRTLADPEQFKSYNLGFVEFEEGSMLTEQAFDLLLSRLRQAKKPEWDNHFHYSFFVHTNPGGLRGWIYKTFINPKTKVEGYRYINAPTNENIFLGKDYVESMKKKFSKDQFRELVEGKDNDFDNTVAFPDFEEMNIREHIKFNPNYPLILTCDFNYNPMCWYLQQYYDNKWFILKEMVINNITTDQMCKIAQTYIDQYGVKKFKMMGDSHGKDKKTNGSDYGIMMNYFQKRGYNPELRIANANPPIKERLALLRSLICNVNGERRVYVDSSCKILLYNFDSCRNNLSNGGLKIPTDTEIQKDNNLRFLIHPIDAISYPMWYENRYNSVKK